MAEARDGKGTVTNSFAWSIPLSVGNPLLAAATDFNSKLLETVAIAHKEWGEFVHQRISDYIATSRQLMKCQSFEGLQEIYSRYLHTAFE